MLRRRSRLEEYGRNQFSQQTVYQPHYYRPESDHRLIHRRESHRDARYAADKQAVQPPRHPQRADSDGEAHQSPTDYDRELDAGG